MVRLKFRNDFKMLEYSKPWKWCRTLFRLKLKSLLPPEWKIFIIQNWYKNICLNMVYTISISNHIKKLLISNIFTNNGKFVVLVYQVTYACHTIISKEITMFNLNYLNICYNLSVTTLWIQTVFLVAEELWIISLSESQLKDQKNLFWLSFRIFCDILRKTRVINTDAYL